MVGGTTPPQSDSGEISRVLGLNLLWQSKRCSRTAQDISVLTTPSLLSMATRQGNDRSILVEDYLSSHHREERGNVPDLILWNRPIISRQHYEVRELSSSSVPLTFSS